MNAHVQGVEQDPCNPSGGADARIGLSRSSGGVRNVSIEPWNPTFDELVEETSRPEVGVKDVIYFVRGPCSVGATRSD